MLGVTLVTVTCAAQQVGFVDLTEVVGRTEFRRPLPRDNNASRVRGATRKLQDCDRTASGAPTLYTTLVWLDRNEYQVGDEEGFDRQN